MSFSGIYRLLPDAPLIAMAKWEIKKRFGSTEALWWAFMPGEVVTVSWPNGYVTGSIFLSSDPNDHYRNWLEENVGKQGFDWNWRIGELADIVTGLSSDKLDIKFRKGKLEQATLFKLKFG